MAGFPDKVIQHLRFAKNWLDRAEEEYSKEQILEAELTLSLAEAEVRHAWETSRGWATSATLRKMRRWRSRIALGLAVVALVLVGGYLVNNREPDYPNPGFSLGQPVVPGRWESQIQYQIVISPEPSPGVTEPQLPSAEVAPLPTVAPEGPAQEVSRTESLAIIAESVEPAVTEPIPTPVSEPEPVPISAVEVEPEPESAPEMVAEPIQPTELADEVVLTPPQLNLGELFKIANDVLKGE